MSFFINGGLTVTAQTPLDAHLLALPESAASSLYGLVDVLAATGPVCRELAGMERGPDLIRPRIVSLGRERFSCAHGVPVQPDLAIGEGACPEILIVTDLWLAPDDAMLSRYAGLKSWLKECRESGTTIYAACSGSVLLAAAGLLDGLDVTSHWAYEDLFRRNFPDVRFDPAPSICFSSRDGRLVTAGGASSWHQLALHVIARHTSPGEAVRVAKVFLLKWHSDGNLLDTNHMRNVAHADSVVRCAEDWLTKHFRDPDPVAGVGAACGIAERSLKRRFRQATGLTLIAYAQNLRIEAAKQELESGSKPVDRIAVAVGYENVAFFRRLFKRHTGLSPGEYRRMFRPQQGTA